MIARSQTPGLPWSIGARYRYHLRIAGGGGDDVSPAALVKRCQSRQSCRMSRAMEHDGGGKMLLEDGNERRISPAVLAHCLVSMEQS